MDIWDGKERRSDYMFNKDFYDKMMEMHNNIQHIAKWSESHNSQDDFRFKNLDNKIDWLFKSIYVGIGGLSVLQLIFSFF